VSSSPRRCCRAHRAASHPARHLASRGPREKYGILDRHRASCIWPRFGWIRPYPAAGIRRVSRLIVVPLSASERADSALAADVVDFQRSILARMTSLHRPDSISARSFIENLELSAFSGDTWAIKSRRNLFPLDRQPMEESVSVFVTREFSTRLKIIRKARLAGISQKKLRNVSRRYQADVSTVSALYSARSLEQTETFAVPRERPRKNKKPCKSSRNR